MEIHSTPIPNPENLVAPVFRALKDLGGAASKHDVIQQILKNEGVPNSLWQLQVKVRGRQVSELSRNIGYACTCLKENGFVSYPSRGFWSLTDKGRAANQINHHELWANYERIRRIRTPRQQKNIDERTTGPVRILPKDDLLQPVLDALHTLDGSGSAFEISQQIVVSEQLIAPSLLEDNFLENSERARRLYNNISTAQTALKKAGLIVNRGSIWSLSSKGDATENIDIHSVRQAEISQTRSRKEARAAEFSTAITKAKEEVREELRAESIVQAQDLAVKLAREIVESQATSSPQKETRLIEHSAEHSIPTNNSYTENPSFLLTLQQILIDRRIRRPPNSYSTQLFAAGPARIAQKVGEEALEVVIAALHETRERQISEVADLLVHTLILLVELNIPLEEVLAELQRRHEARTS